MSLAVLAHIARAHWRSARLRGDRLERYRDRRARLSARYAWEHAPFFRMHWEGHDINAWDVLPTIDKAAMMTHFSTYNTAGVSADEAVALAVRAERNRSVPPSLRGLTVGLSSGTSGHRGLFLVDARERAGWAGTVIARAIRRPRRGLRVALVLRANSNLYETVGSGPIRFCFVDVETPDDAMVARLGAFRPDVLVGPPSMLDRIAPDLARTIRPEQVVSVAEVLEPHVAARITAAFGVGIDQIYQCTEGLLAVTCSRGRLHVQEDLVAVQWEPGPAADTWTPIVTDLWRRVQPIVRYRLNDLVRLGDAPCACGSPFRVLDAVEGRMDDVLWLDGIDGAPRPIAPDSVRRAVLLAHEGIEDYEIVQTGASSLRIRVVPGGSADLTALGGGVEGEFRRAMGRLGVAPAEVLVEFVPVIPRAACKVGRVRREPGLTVGAGVSAV